MSSPPNQSASQSTSQPANQSASKPANQSTNQQANQSTNPPARMNEIVRQNIVEYTSRDFNDINITHNECTLVLFYNNNAESKNLISIWIDVASLVVGPVFAICNLFNEKDVARSFTNISADSAEYAYKLQQFPFIFVYRGGKPRGVYNGGHDMNSISNYALTMACRSEYSENKQTSYGVTNDAKWLQTGHEQYTPAMYKSSSDFTSNVVPANNAPTNNTPTNNAPTNNAPTGK